MAFWFLPNSFGAYATSQTTGTVQTAYDKTNIIAGPRSTRVRTTTEPVNYLGYESDTDVECTHVIIARADWLLTETGGQVTESERDGSGTWYATAEFDLNPIEAADLVGITSQDYVAEIAPTYFRGLRLVH